MLSKLREKYWIPKADAALRKILSKCVQCRMLSGKPGEQRMANLPQEHLVSDTPPFTNVGIDYFGPFQKEVLLRDMMFYLHALPHEQFI